MYSLPYPGASGAAGWTHDEVVAYPGMVIFSKCLSTGQFVRGCWASAFHTCWYQHMSNLEPLKHS